MASSGLVSPIANFPSPRGLSVTQSPRSPFVSFSSLFTRLPKIVGSTCCGRLPVIKAMAETTKKYVGTHVREKHLEEMIERKVTEAKEVCEGNVTSVECKVAWDEVEEVSQAKADLRRKMQESQADPLESYCQENPETDECRIYED